MQGPVVHFQFTGQTYKYPDKTENVRTNYAGLSSDFQFTGQTYKNPDKTENVRTNYAKLSG